jgi:RNA recognition motif-containing protein
MSSELFFVNVPYNCSDRELKDWMEIRGFKTAKVRIIHDLVSGASPAFAYATLADETDMERAIAILDGDKLRNQSVKVSRACRAAA